MVQVDGDGDVGHADGGLNEFLEVNRIGVLARTLRDLQDERGFFLFAGFNDGLDEFHVVHVKRAEGVLAFERFGEQVFGMCQWHKYFILGFSGTQPPLAPTARIIENPARKKIKIY